MTFENIKFKCIKGLAMLGSLNVNEKELAADLQSGCVYGLEPREAEILIDEFVFIIEKLEKNTHSDIMHSCNRDFLFNGIKHLFSSGETMLSIYKSTCATKNLPTGIFAMTMKISGIRIARNATKIL